MIRYRMRGHQPIESRRLQAILFLKLMAVWNLFEWLDSLLEIHANLQRRRIDFAIHNAASLFVVVYDALVVDYRLLCATVFYEKAMGLEKIHQATDDLSNCYTHRRRGRPFQGLENWCRLLAFSLGPLTAVIPILKILNISGNYFALPAIANDTILTISLDAVGIMCIAIVLFLLWYNKLEIDTEEHEYTQILIFVMGWVGLLFWGLYGGAALILYNDKNYESMESKLYYSGVKSIIHVISLFLQMGFFIHVPTNFYHYRRVVWFNFLFIFMTWLFISQFIAEIVDQETVSLDHVFQSSCKIPSSLSIFFQVAHPLMVGFRFHVCLHTSQAAMAIKFDTVKISRVKANSFHDITVKAMQKGKTISLSKIDDSTPVAVGLNLKDSDLDTEMKGSDRTYSVRSNSVQGGSLRGGSIRSSSIIINDMPLQEEVFAPSSRVF
ncbi:uncharacterized protein TRIADDRAFT_63530 [Trichoplax adhaerens]|uniref:Uncharacterized protein n=1 Tax=Trichoplax adhaerens TaxID=10228 RepID=B3RM95_TRIAD|nr:predicted protein [Trichoplax adhaerens]EDV29660.1 predicted protein [Trichoplax adhaerens]|eukprot:XP_002108862.1 predicted protein [Trichoplax adhaerens]